MNKCAHTEFAVSYIIPYMSVLVAYHFRSISERGPKFLVIWHQKINEHLWAPQLLVVGNEPNEILYLLTLFLYCRLLVGTIGKLGTCAVYDTMSRLNIAETEWELQALQNKWMNVSS